MAQRPAPRIRRFILRSLLALLLSGLVLAVAGALYWQHLKRQQGIERLDWDGLSLGFNHVRVDRLNLQLDKAGSSLNASAEDLHLGWRWADGLHLETLQSSRVTADWQPATTAAEADSAALPFSRPDPRELLPAWLPRNVRVEHLALRLPCAQGSCPLTGRLALQHGGTPNAPARLDLHVQHQGRTLHMQAQVAGPVDTVDLAVRLQVEQQTCLTLTSIFRELPDGRRWSGHLDLPELPDAAWLLAWVEQWSGPQPRLQGAADLRLRADWDWQLAPGALDASQLRALNGHINVDGNLPLAWPLPGIGNLQGSAAVQLQASAGRWRARHLQADLSLEQPDPTLFRALPQTLRPATVRLRVQQAEAPPEQPDALALQVQLDSSGALQLDAQAQLRVNPMIQGWWLQVDSSRIRASGARLQRASVDGRALRLNLQLAGRVDAEGFQLTLDPASSAAVGELLIASGAEPTRLKDLQLERAALDISGTLPGAAPAVFNVAGRARLRAGQILHPAVKPLGWSWEGQLKADPAHQQFSGSLGNGAGLDSQLELTRNAEALTLSASLPEHFLRNGNPLAATLADWPALLELNNGRLQLDAQLRLPTTGTLQAQIDAQFKGVDGLYDRTEFSGLDSRLSVQLKAQELHLAIEGLQLQQANPGIAIGPLHFDGDYRAALAQLTQGQLAWRTARSGLLGGELWLEPGTLRLGQAALLPVQLRGLQLQALFRAYPAEGLSGRGTLDGVLPLGIGAAGVRIVDGQITAREPGGQLQFRSPKITALGRSNPAMQLVADALADFHYDLLSSGVDYDAQGKLRLALKLEGRNPDIERGRPINFSINLEEDIPALLTSLQLTGRVSERVRERVQQHMQQSRPTP